VTHFTGRSHLLGDDRLGCGVDLCHSLRPKIANGQVARGDCSPRAPTDPYVPTLEHTAPHIRRLPHDARRPNAPHAMVAAGTIAEAD
jgi:hypothetical protein